MNASVRWVALVCAAMGLTRPGWGTELPLARVVLFTSGVGYFEREGEIDGRQTVDLSFETGQVPDVIKSLVVMDGGAGRIQAVTYDARDPVERTLKAFSLDLSDNPSLGALLNRARGIPIRVQSGAQSYEGSVLGVEKRRQAIAEPRTVVETEHLNLLTPDGIRSLPLESLQGVQVLDPAVSRDLTEALDVLAGSVARDRRGVRLSFDDSGRRPVRVSYLLEAPVWKTSYRLVLDEDGGFLQGWAHVENMTDEDWTGVDLALVSGRPISFVQNLYDPVYLRRPVVEMDLAALAAPPAYDAVLADAEPAEGRRMARAPGSPVAMRGRAAALQAVAPSAMMEESEKPAMDRAALARSVDVLPGAGEAGELFRYPGGRVTLPRRQSAMIPIVNRAVTAQPVSIFNEGVHAKHPLNGAALTNDTGLFLMQGPVTVFADGEYAGDARLGDTARNEDRLLSYALDLQSEVKVERRSEPEEIVSMRIVRGVLEVSRRFVEETLYRARNKREVARVLMIQHPHRADWDLTAPGEGVERARDEYRIRVELGPDAAEEVRVRQEKRDRHTVRLAAVQSDQVAFYLRQRQVSPALREALTRLAEMQREQAEARAAREQLERKRQDMTREQERIRANMQAVSRPSESFTMWERRLVSQEEEITEANLEIERLHTVEREKQAEIARFIAGLDVE